MSLVRVYDGTRDAKFGQALMQALGEIAKYKRVQIVGTHPGQLDVPGYNLVKQIERRHLNSRGQVHLERLVVDLVNHPQVGHNPRVATIVITDNDLYSDRVNWCFGSVNQDTDGANYLTLSTARIQDPIRFRHVATHELGHLFGAASRGRRNTVENLGPHCTNQCVMEQKLSEEEMHRHARVISAKTDKFCHECQEELRRTR